MNAKSFITRIARDVRSACVEHAFDTCSIGTPWYKRSDLAGMCTVASFSLKEIFELMGIGDASVYNGVYHIRGGGIHEHSWVTVESMIIDITATQFGASSNVSVHKMNFRRYSDSGIITRLHDINNGMSSHIDSIHHTYIRRLYGD